MELVTLKPTEAASGTAVANWSGADTDARLVAVWLQSKPSPKTRKEYAAAAKRFLDAVGKPLNQITLPDLLAYGERLQQAGLKLTTIKTEQMIIKSLFSFAAKTGYLRWDVGKAWPAFRPPDGLTNRILTESEVLTLINSAKSQRDRTLLRFLYFTGLRVSEVAALTWDSIRKTEDGAVLSVYGKGRKTRYVAIDTELLNELIALNPEQKGPVFVSQRRRPLSARRIESLIADIGRKALGKPVSPHWLRHCAATHSLRRGLSVTDVAATLGHSNIAVTSRYLHPNPKVRLSDYLPK